MAQVIPLRPHTFRVDNILIDDYAADIGALGVAVYVVLVAGVTIFWFAAPPSDQKAKL